jgi:hypothetical protein
MRSGTSSRRRRGLSGAGFDRGVIETRHADAPHFQHVAKSFGRHQRGARALAFEDRVGGDGGGVEDLGKIGRLQAQPRGHVGNAGQDGAGVVARRGRHFGGGQRAIGRKAGDVGKGAADVGRDAIAGHGQWHR